MMNMSPLVPDILHPDPDAPLTIAEFCKRYHISKDIYYRMRLKGETPRETVLSPRRRVILAASLREWERNKAAS